MKLALNDVFRFFEAKNINLLCPCCQQAVGFVMGFGPNESATAFTYGSHPENTNGYSFVVNGGFAKPVITIECPNCGFIRTFNYHVVFNWAVHNPSPTVGLTNLGLPNGGKL